MKKLWKQNRVLFMLIVILVICFITIVSVALTFFYSKEVDSYGNRLKDIDKYPISESFQKEYKDSLLENENVVKSSLLVKGRVIYVNATFDDAIGLEEAKNVITKTLDQFSEDILSYYDIQFILKSDNFTIIGAKNAVIDHISWNNNLELPEEESNENE